MKTRAQVIGYKCLTGKTLTQPERVWMARLIKAAQDQNIALHDLLNTPEHSPQYIKTATKAGDTYLALGAVIAEEAPATTKEGA